MPSTLLSFDPLSLLRRAAQSGDWAELFVERTQLTSLVLEDGSLEEITSSLDIGAGLRIMQGHRAVYGYTNDLSREGIQDLLRSVTNLTSKEQEPLLSPRLSVVEWPRKIPAEAAPLADKILLMQRAFAAAKRPDMHQIKVCFFNSLRQIEVYTSEGLAASDLRPQVTLTVEAMAKQGGLMGIGYEMFGGTAGLELLQGDAPEQVAALSAERALRLLSARPSPSGVMPVILAAEAGGTMVHEAIGHGLEADLCARQTSVYAGRVGEAMAPKFISIIDDPTLSEKRGSFHIDDEGLSASPTILVQEGVLKAYLSDRVNAERLQIPRSANGRRESYRNRPIPRMSNIYIAKGTDDPKKILAETPSGLYVTRMGGGEVDPTTGDFVFEVNEAFIIERGELTRPVRGATLAGNGPEVLFKIDRLGNDLGFGLGSCGKDGQSVAVSDAQPTMRISELIVGGTD
jgi:TldD protein